mgnify:CR=1 FL=1
MVSEPTLAVSQAQAWEGGTLQNGIRADSRGFTGACVAVAQAWCAWLVWTRSGHTAWHMCWHWTHGRGQVATSFPEADFQITLGLSVLGLE